MRDRLPAPASRSKSSVRQKQHELDVVMVERAGGECSRDVERDGADQQRRQRDLFAADTARNAQQQEERRGIERQRPQRPAPPFRPLPSMPVIAETARTIAAIGASTRRDQCIEKPPSPPIRYWWRSNQPCPASEVAHLDQPHQAVIVAAAVGEHREAARGRHEADDQGAAPSASATCCNRDDRAAGRARASVIGLPFGFPENDRRPKPSLNGFNK